MKRSRRIIRIELQLFGSRWNFLIKFLYFLGVYRLIICDLVLFVKPSKTSTTSLITSKLIWKDRIRISKIKIWNYRIESKCRDNEKTNVSICKSFAAHKCADFCRVMHAYVRISRTKDFNPPVPVCYIFVKTAYNRNFHNLGLAEVSSRFS